MLLLAIIANTVTDLSKQCIQNVEQYSHLCHIYEMPKIYIIINYITYNCI